MTISSSKLRKNGLIFLLLLLFVSGVLTISDYLAITGMNLGEKFPRPLFQHFLSTLCLSSVVFLAFPKRAFFAFLYTFLIFSFFQWLTMSYYGTFLSPMMIYLFFRELGEITETFLGIWPILFKPALVFLVSLGLLFCAGRVLARKGIEETVGAELLPKTRRLLRIIILLMLAFPAIRTYITHNTYGKQARVQDLSFVNFHATLSYFLGRVLPTKMTAQAQTSDNYVVEQPKIVESQPQRQVVLIIGESLSTSRMGLYNSTKQTTPQLNSLRDSGQVVTRMGVSGGVSTDVSVPMLIHSTFGLDASKVISSQKNCLFRLARQNGFATDFISIQTPENLQHITNFLCPSYIDHYQAGEPPSQEGGESVDLDEKLLTSLQQIDWKKPHFIVLQQRGSHSPYENRYPSEGALLPISSKDSNDVKQSKHYENSVFYTDQVISKAVALIEESSPLPAEIIFTSDHGEALGENGQWGHGLLDPYVAEVPILYFSRNLTLKKQFDQAPKWIDHYYVSNFVQFLLGYQSKSSSTSPSTNASSLESSSPSFTVLGLDLDGLDGYMQVAPSNDKLMRVKNSP